MWSLSSCSACTELTAHCADWRHSLCWTQWLCEYRALCSDRQTSWPSYTLLSVLCIVCMCHSYPSEGMCACSDGGVLVSLRLFEMSVWRGGGLWREWRVESWGVATLRVGGSHTHTHTHTMQNMVCQRLNTSYLQSYLMEAIPNLINLITIRYWVLWSPGPPVDMLITAPTNLPSMTSTTTYPACQYTHPPSACRYSFNIE